MENYLSVLDKDTDFTIMWKVTMVVRENYIDHFGVLLKHIEKSGIVLFILYFCLIRRSSSINIVSCTSDNQGTVKKMGNKTTGLGAIIVKVDADYMYICINIVTVICI